MTLCLHVPNSSSYSFLFFPPPPPHHTRSLWFGARGMNTSPPPGDFSQLWFWYNCCALMCEEIKTDHAVPIVCLTRWFISGSVKLWPFPPFSQDFKWPSFFISLFPPNIPRRRCFPLMIGSFCLPTPSNHSASGVYDPREILNFPLPLVIFFIPLKDDCFLLRGRAFLKQLLSLRYCSFSNTFSIHSDVRNESWWGFPFLLWQFTLFFPPSKNPLQFEISECGCWFLHVPQFYFYCINCLV